MFPSLGFASISWHLYYLSRFKCIDFATQRKFHVNATSIVYVVTTGVNRRCVDFGYMSPTSRPYYNVILTSVWRGVLCRLGYVSPHCTDMHMVITNSNLTMYNKPFKNEFCCLVSLLSLTSRLRHVAGEIPDDYSSNIKLANMRGLFCSCYFPVSSLTSCLQETSPKKDKRPFASTGYFTKQLIILCYL